MIIYQFTNMTLPKIILLAIVSVVLAFGGKRAKQKPVVELSGLCYTMLVIKQSLARLFSFVYNRTFNFAVLIGTKPMVYFRNELSLIGYPAIFPFKDIMDFFVRLFRNKFNNHDNFVFFHYFQRTLHSFYRQYSILLTNLQIVFSKFCQVFGKSALMFRELCTDFRQITTQPFLFWQELQKFK